MDTVDIKNAARILKDMCEDTLGCGDCMFNDIGTGCRLYKVLPYEWNIDNEEKK